MAIRPPSLRAIAAFDAAARLGSFAKAAEELNLTHSAISHAVRGLEERLGVMLFDRGRTALTLTPAGATLASRTRLSLSLLTEAFEPQSAPTRALLVVSTLTSVAQHIIIPRLPDFLATHGDIEIELHATRKLADIKNNEADIAVRFGRGQWPGVSATLLAADTVFPVASPLYRSGNLPSTLADLMDCEIIAHPAISWRAWLDAAGVSGALPKGRLTTDDSALMIAAAISGCGIALVNETLVRSDLEAGCLVKLFPIEVEDDYAHWAVWNASSPKLLVVQQFIDWIRSVFEDLNTRS
jgi:LysR family glycine cleavage system transcriptional activator